MRRSFAAAGWAGVLLLVACASPDVTTEGADNAAPGSVPVPTEVSVPETDDGAASDPDAGTDGTDPDDAAASPDDAAPSPDDPSTTDADPGPTERTGDELRDPDTSVGDSLFEQLGSVDVDVLEYDVRLEYDPDTVTVAGTVGITALVPLDVAALSLDSDGPAVEAARVDGEAVRDEGIVDDGAELLVDLPADRDERVVVEIDYLADVGDVGGVTGLPTGWNVALGGSYVLNQPDGGRSWMPSSDHPSDKAEWRFEITVPDGLTAAANGTLVERPTPDGSDDGDDEPDTWVWELDEPMPTYLVQVIVGDYEVIEAEPYESIDGREIPITHIVPRGQLDRFGPAVDTVDDRMRFFEERFGRYPLAGYGLAFVDGFAGGAMETQGRSMFPADLAWDEPDDVLTELLLAHELAHQWFGNAVSPGDWGDIWLNESFATYVQWMWFDEIGIQPIEEPAALNLARRQSPGAPTGAPGVDGMFGYTVYDGGAPIVHALRLIVGDETFFEILERWIEVYSIGSASTDDFIAVAEDVHGDELSGFFDLWLYSAALPDEYPS